MSDTMPSSFPRPVAGSSASFDSVAAAGAAVPAEKRPPSPPPSSPPLPLPSVAGTVNGVPSPAAAAAAAVIMPPSSAKISRLPDADFGSIESPSLRREHQATFSCFVSFVDDSRGERERATGSQKEEMIVPCPSG